MGNGINSGAKLEFAGKISLIEETEGNIFRYFLKVDLRVEDRTSPYPGETNNLLVPVSFDTYQRVRKAMESSQAECRVISCEGQLEIKVAPVCIN